MGLGSARSEVSWVNIWQDPEAARFVAGHRDGNETVPTAVTGGGVMVEAEPETIKARLASSSS